MKKKHLVLYITSLVLLCISDFPGSSLIALGLIFQLNLLFFNIPLTKVTQKSALLLFLSSIPFFLLYSGILSFLFVYLKEAQFIFFLGYLIVHLGLSFASVFLCFLVFHNMTPETHQISYLYSLSFSQIKEKKREILRLSFLTCLFSLIPYLSADWKIIFSLLSTQLISHPDLLKQVFFPSK